MAIAKSVGVRAGKLVGWTAATAWKGTVMLAGAAGEAGEGFVEGAQQGWESRSAELDLKIAAHKLKVAQLRAEAIAARAEPAPVAAPTPVAA